MSLKTVLARDLALCVLIWTHRGMWYSWFAQNSSWKGSSLKRQFLKRIHSEKTVPEKDPVWKDSSWKGSILTRQFLKRIQSEKTVPEKDQAWKDTTCFFLEQNMNIYHNGGAFSFWDLLIRAFKPLHYKLQDHYCFKLFLVYFACCEFQVLRLKKSQKKSYECPKLFFVNLKFHCLRHSFMEPLFCVICIAVILQIYGS